MTNSSSLSNFNSENFSYAKLIQKLQDQNNTEEMLANKRPRLRAFSSITKTEDEEGNRDNNNNYYLYEEVVKLKENKSNSSTTSSDFGFYSIDYAISVGSSDSDGDRSRLMSS